MLKVICWNCHSEIMYDMNDTDMNYGTLTEIYIHCPCCGKKITVGVV